MKKYAPMASLLLGLAASFSCFSAEPAELTSARGNYQKQIKTLTDPVNARYLAYLESLKKSLGAKGDLDGALAVQKEIDSLPAPATTKAAENAGSDKIVIWNQNNGGKADRGTKKVSVSLWVGSREVWNKKFVHIDWDPTKQTKVEILVPTMTADKLRVQVTETVNDRGGLAEIEFFRGGRNVAAKGAATVSAVWENSPKHMGSMLTDGDMATWWLLPDNQEGWAEIMLAP
ncbi:MAG: hypothetical protein K9N47_28910 [Prosthecobacter sp.]|uniref:hypothetical protein n=1 Tax=Prosthecobacter sp. TaxID=1965333 RepID=UPI00262E969A|nr:hypothetical protein [Prosthecobacter sp.]MCF7790174.1 hypothetical protein [Prosthecobacter sp.]